MESPPILKKKRYHDLDALRATAMLLGILLHGVISFMGEKYWPIQDTQSPYWEVPAEIHEAGSAIGMELPEEFSPYKFVFMQAIHGFRMPLFFVVSGFFAAMLWRQRGMKEMLKHRAKRILLPLFTLGAVMIIATWIAMITGGLLANMGGESKKGNPSDLWSSAEQGDVEGIYRALKSGTDINAKNKEGQSALSLAVFWRQKDAVKALLEKEADINSANGPNQDTPLHMATFVVDAELVELLLEYGANPLAKNTRNETPLAVVRGEWSSELEGVYKFIGGLTKREFDMERIKRERLRVREILVNDQRVIRQEDTASTKLERDEKKEFLGGEQFRQHYEKLPDWAKPISWIIGGVIGAIWAGSMVPAFHHLWFLFYLMIIILLFALVMWIAKKWKFRAWADWTIKMPLCLLWLFPLTFIAQVTMWQSFGPDTHTGPIPWPPKVLYYAIFFGFGALCHGRDVFEEQLGKYWWLSFLIAVPVLLVGVGFLETRNVQLGTQLSQGNFKPIVISHLIASACIVLYCWLVIFGFIGVFRQFFSGENKTIRYLSDSSYWLYVAHMPLMMFLQGLVAPWAMPSLVKFLLVCGVTVGLLLLMYEYVIRYTFVGTMLNGKLKREPAAS